MARQCELTGKKPMAGNTFSHAKNRTRRVFRPNLCNVTIHSEKLNESFSLRVSAAALRTLDKVGGIDNFLMNAKDEKLSPKAMQIKAKLV